MYNEEEVIDEFSGRLLESLKETADDYEIVFVVEREDKTMEKLREFSSVNPNVKLDYNQKTSGAWKGREKGTQPRLPQNRLCPHHGR